MELLLLICFLHVQISFMSHFSDLFVVASKNYIYCGNLRAVVFTMYLRALYLHLHSSYLSSVTYIPQFMHWWCFAVLFYTHCSWLYCCATRFGLASPLCHLSPKMQIFKQEKPHKVSSATYLGTASSLGMIT